MSWNCKQQTTIALSTTEAEYSFLGNSLVELNMDSGQQSTTIFCNNKSVVRLASTQNYHPRFQNIDICQNFLREKRKPGFIKFESCSTNEGLASRKAYILLIWNGTQIQASIE